MALSPETMQFLLAAAVIAVPIITIVINNWATASRTKAAEDAAIARRKEDNDRLDLVASRAEKAAERNASLIAESTDAAVKRGTTLEGKVNVLHTLVNSSYTLVLQSNLDGLRRELKLEQRVEPQDPAIIETLTVKINDLQAVVDERNKRDVVVTDLKKQQEEAAEAVAVIVGTPAPTTVAPKLPPAVGPVTAAVLAGVTASSEVASAAKDAVKVIASAKATVSAAEDTVKAATKSD